MMKHTNKKAKYAPEHHEVSSRDEAWALCNELFPTDYDYDTERSHNAGYPIYGTTDSAFARTKVFEWISDLNTRLELNLAKCKTIIIDIVEPEKISWDYNGQY